MCNPISGARKGEKIAKKVVSKFASIGINTHVIYLTEKGQAEQLCMASILMTVDQLKFCFIRGDPDEIEPTSSGLP